MTEGKRPMTLYLTQAEHRRLEIVAAKMRIAKSQYVYALLKPHLDRLSKQEGLGDLK